MSAKYFALQKKNAFEDGGKKRSLFSFRHTFNCGHTSAPVLLVMYARGAHRAEWCSAIVLFSTSSRPFPATANGFPAKEWAPDTMCGPQRGQMWALETIGYSTFRL
jgi:hypothetical protein